MLGKLNLMVVLDTGKHGLEYATSCLRTQDSQSRERGIQLVEIVCVLERLEIWLGCSRVALVDFIDSGRECFECRLSAVVAIGRNAAQ